jgi:methanogenic corrinoid protein MtbC1
MDYSVYQKTFLSAILAGDRNSGSAIIAELSDSGCTIQDIYEKVIRHSLYKVGDLWESGQISVASEHLASAIVESILNEQYSIIISQIKTNKTVVAASVENEVHQIGLKMVSDIFEMSGFNVHYLGANNPLDDLVNFIDTVKPNILAVSVSINYHLNSLEKLIEAIRDKYPNLIIITGGQGLRDNNKEIIKKYPNIMYLQDLYALEEFLKNTKAA